MSAVLNQSGTGFIRRQQQFVAFVNGNGGQNNNQTPLNPPGPTPPRDQPDTGFPEVAQQMLAESNRIRNSWGLESKVLDAKLVAAAQRHADDMAARGFLDHTGSDGSSVGRRVMDAGFRFSLLAENIAEGQPNVSTVFVGWVNSSGHNENMRRNATLAGFASAKRGGRIYWVSVYASPMR
jgi:uncharacterized protein YkwD